jgi:hypothetical protein
MADSISAPLCSGCLHFMPDEPELVCKAYPGGIPDAIIEGKVDHRKPFKGDNGIRFEPLQQKK